MGGSVQYHKPAKRWYIAIFWKGKHYKLWRDYDTFQPFFTRSRALKYLAILQKQVEDHDFDPLYWSPESPVSIEKYAMEWLNEKDVTYRTWRDYKTDITKYIIPYFGTKDIRHIKAKDIKRFKKHLESLNLSTKSVYNKMSTLRTMFRDAYRDEDIRRVPPFPILSAGQLIRPESLTLEQQENLLNKIPQHHRAIFAFGMEYGLRVGEVRAIQKDCIGDGKVIIKRAFSDNNLKNTKTGLNREYELTDYAKNILDGLDKHLGPFVFVRKDGKPYTNKNLNEIWRLACKETGIKIKLQNAMRHSLGCQLVDMGCDIYHVADQLGHTDVRTTKRYAARSRETLKKKLEDRRKVVPFSGRIVDEE